MERSLSLAAPCEHADAHISAHFLPRDSGSHISFDCLRCPVGRKCLLSSPLGHCDVTATAHQGKSVLLKRRCDGDYSLWFPMGWKSSSHVCMHSIQAWPKQQRPNAKAMTCFQGSGKSNCYNSGEVVSNVLIVNKAHIFFVILLLSATDH